MLSTIPTKRLFFFYLSIVYLLVAHLVVNLTTILKRRRSSNENKPNKHEPRVISDPLTLTSKTVYMYREWNTRRKLIKEPATNKLLLALHWWSASIYIYVHYGQHCHSSDHSLRLVSCLYLIFFLHTSDLGSSSWQFMCVAIYQLDVSSLCEFVEPGHSFHQLFLWICGFFWRFFISFISTNFKAHTCANN